MAARSLTKNMMDIMQMSTMIDSNVVRPHPEQVARAFLTPRRPPQREPLTLEGGEALRIATPEGEVALQRAGSGPAVLLLHGWEGQASDLAAFAPPLLDAGFSVLAMDLPAHGDSAGRQTSIPQCARALRAVGEAIGPLHAVIAHSIGSAVLAEALHAGLVVQRAVLVSAPAHYERHARGFAAAAGLDGEATEAMLASISSAVGADVREISLPRRAPQLRQRALFIHSADDRVVAIEESLDSASVWPGARHMRVEGLGHRRLLGNPAVIAAAIDFVAMSH
ncbi:alpha/beta fold hydrolase [Variovorax sp. J22G21]|uniref:alpha/beta fold hydrolase n=1 Tax=Variovorax fucosicus TaxID=3053517 RepID=UPI0025790453|nr:MULTISPECIES: alpha/beta fold hydrolase [unclassified Variovorax]MDM0042772.1 alpha/beta fold hydrolase [Variovorax sp. J22R193]MDM0064833.1 alpha/beta fold hydrolase [Variovorax sp. J22G21]